ncbi:hypothetical protein [Methylobacterium oryzisoli]|uniref:hypothetical protein n=1 Tax=Methylobacterium oryzisoli TaxID=3385502 RepID=UPI0038914E63
MSVVPLAHRVRKLDCARSFKGDLNQLSDAQLWALIRSGYPDLERKHGSLAGAIEHLRGTGDSDDRALAILIAEDIGYPPAGSMS